MFKEKNSCRIKKTKNNYKSKKIKNMKGGDSNIDRFDRYYENYLQYFRYIDMFHYFNSDMTILGIHPNDYISNPNASVCTEFTKAANAYENDTQNQKKMKELIEAKDNLVKYMFFTELPEYYDKVLYAYGKLSSKEQKLYEVLQKKSFLDRRKQD